MASKNEPTRESEWTLFGGIITLLLLMAFNCPFPIALVIAGIVASGVD